jgi:DNA ligase-associated metallophosphoesterase
MMTSPYPYQIRDQQLWLSNERCIFWENQQLLILSDTHFGKSGHFRKESIPVPQGVIQTDIIRLSEVIHYFQPQGIIIIGDLFHSSFNKEINYFNKFRQAISETEFHLITGNHDILNRDIYRKIDIYVHENILHLPPFSFVHDMNHIIGANGNYYFCGHLHPGIEINAKAKQKLRFPCFHFTKQYACLPAFSKFTGISKIQHNKKDEIFLVTDEGVISY